VITSGFNFFALVLQITGFPGMFMGARASHPSIVISHVLRLLTGLFLLFATLVCNAQNRGFGSLQAEISAGRVQLSDIAGTGGSTGTVITARLANKTGAEVRILVDLAEPLFFVNAGPSQNMIATRVYLDGGRYVSDGKQNFIVIGARSSQRIVFLAFCADFGKDNPSPEDRFSVSAAPSELRPVMARISNFLQRNPKALMSDLTVAAQAAIWLVQGASLSDINAKFPVSSTQAQLAEQFAR